MSPAVNNSKRFAGILFLVVAGIVLPGEQRSAWATCGDYLSHSSAHQDQPHDFSDAQTLVSRMQAGVMPRPGRQAPTRQCHGSACQRGNPVPLLPKPGIQVSTDSDAILEAAVVLDPVAVAVVIERLSSRESDFLAVRIYRPPRRLA